MNDENRNDDGSGWFLQGNKWWAVVREGTINILVSTYETEEEAKANYQMWQHKWDTERISCVKWKQGKNRYGNS